MNSKLKVFISIFISLIMALQTAFPALANTSLDNSTDTSIEYCIDDEYAENQETFEKIKSFDEEIADLDELAQYYYDYYNEHGTYPSESEISTLSVTNSKVVSLLASVGITTTTSKIAELAASIGTLGILDGPAPVLDVLAILLGIYFVASSDYNYSFTEIKRLNNKSEEIQSAASDAVTTKKQTVRTNVAKALATAYAAALSSRNDNIKYYACERNEGIGGGVTVKEPLSFNEALNRILKTYDVYCIDRTAAYELAKAGSMAIPGSTVKKDEAHNIAKQPLNLPHYHIEINGSHDTTLTHIFFPV